MHAIQFEDFGEPATLVPREVPDAAADTEEVVIEVRAAAVNHSDIKNVRGMMRAITKLPCIPGRDFAGVVVVGPEPLVGQEVWGSGGDLGFFRPGSHAQRLAIPAEGVVPLPDGFSLDEAAASGLPYITAWVALETKGEVQAGQDVLVLGAAGAIGFAATRFARWRGARVIGAVRGVDEAAAARSAGVDVVIDTAAGEDVPTATRNATNGRGADLALDTVGGPLFDVCLHSLRSGGRLVSITTGQPVVEFNLLDFYRSECTVVGVNTALLDTVKCAEILRGLAPGFASGELAAAHVAKRFALTDAGAAYEHLDAGVIGRVVITPHSSQNGDTA